MLIEAGADINVVNNKGESALAVSLSRGNIVLSKLLIEKGAKALGKGENGDSVLMLAVKTGDKAILKSVLKLPEISKQFEQLNKEDGRTPLMEAVGRSNARVVDLLLEAGASPITQNAENKTAQDFVKKEDYSIKNSLASARRSELENTLRDAAITGDLSTIKAAAELGVNFQTTDEEGNNLLALAAKGSNAAAVGSPKAQEYAQVVTFLIERGVGPLLTNNELQPPAQLTRHEDIQKSIQSAAREQTMQLLAGRAVVGAR